MIPFLTGKLRKICEKKSWNELEKSSDEFVIVLTKTMWTPALWRKNIIETAPPQTTYHTVGLWWQGLQQKSLICKVFISTTTSLVFKVISSIFLKRTHQIYSMKKLENTMAWILFVFAYRAHTISSRSLCTLYPISEDHFFISKEFFSENSVFIYGCISNQIKSS